jgi:CMP/dCMP kinase
MIVTIDGPAGAGKSSVARALAARLGFRFLDTGAMYRAVTLAAIRQKLDWNAPEALADLAGRLKIDVDDGHVFLDGEEVTQAIRGSQITALTRHAADNRRVREHLVQLQRQIGRAHDIVTEGRDQGTVVFPDAECKIFLTASAAERARRRMEDLAARGERTTLEAVLADQNRRDQRDASREVGRLVRAPDAVEVWTDGLTCPQVVDRLESLVREKLA